VSEFSSFDSNRFGGGVPNARTAVPQNMQKKDERRAKKGKERCGGYFPYLVLKE
jgi:hypothetical protein